MKRYLPFVFFALASFFISSIASAQIENPVKWNYTAKKTGDKKYDVYVSATIAPGWHLYAQDAGEGPEPTSIDFVKNPLVKVDDGKAKEVGKLHKEYDNNFGSELKYFSDKVDFVKEVKLIAAANTVIKGNVTYMVCNDRKCLPPKTVPFSINVSGK